MGETFGSQLVLPTDDAIRKPMRKDRLSFVPWVRKKQASARPLVTAAAAAAADVQEKIITQESPDFGGRPQKRRLKLSLLSSPTPSQERDEQQHQIS